MHLFDKQVFKESFQPKDLLKVLMWAVLITAFGVYEQYSKHGVYPGMFTNFLSVTLQFALIFAILGAIIDQVRAYFNRKKAA